MTILPVVQLPVGFHVVVRKHLKIVATAKFASIQTRIVRVRCMPLTKPSVVFLVPLNNLFHVEHHTTQPPGCQRKFTKRGRINSPAIPTNPKTPKPQHTVNDLLQQQG